MGVEPDAPELDERTNFWMGAFSILHRTRQPGMSGITPINPVTVLDLAERLEWPCDPEEAISVVIAMDDCFRELNKQPEQNQAA